ncbi:hypothetical protein IMCC14465_06670 [alpha proteobacterium IMCC14465]|uniref:Uncharacterized protein n=1 Tax=alpha proteobacterium IMCC14465 TaxID=1220535 RepID=J9DG50_9PROT|nr:hypothetical protein IMCC14465_06670 [alpha proteobacterium IMCC14465]
MCFPVRLRPIALCVKMPFYPILPGILNYSISCLTYSDCFVILIA